MNALCRSWNRVPAGTRRQRHRTASPESHSVRSGQTWKHVCAGAFCTLWFLCQVDDSILQAAAFTSADDPSESDHGEPATAPVRARTPVGGIEFLSPKPTATLNHPDLSVLQQEKKETLERIGRQAEELLRLQRAKRVKQSPEQGWKSRNDSVPNGVPGVEPSATSDDAATGVHPEQTLPHVTDDASGDHGRSQAAHTEPVGVPANTPSEHAPPSAVGDATNDQTTAEAIAAPHHPEGSAHGSEALHGIAPTVDGIIDRVALATSLFATDRFQECLQTLDAVERDTLSTENSEWCEYLAAGCHRRLGQLGEAESRYRGLVEHSQTSWLVESCRWWLDHLGAQQKLQTELAAVSAEVGRWRAEIDALKNAK
jgi:hypothetical protein